MGRKIIVSVVVVVVVVVEGGGEEGKEERRERAALQPCATAILCSHHFGKILVKCFPLCVSVHRPSK